VARKPKSIRFIDLFAGLGGFHVGLSSLRSVDARCVYASELDERLRRLYTSNFGQFCEGDITRIEASSIPSHDVLCAGFPCQPFSKAGEQLGLDCEMNGDLFEDHLVRIIDCHRPPYLLLENVPNLLQHDGGRTWGHMRGLLEGLGYDVDWKVLSPDQYNMPQVRARLFVVGQLLDRGGLQRFKWPKPSTQKPSIFSVLEDDPESYRPMPDHYIEAVEIWNEFVHRFDKKGWQLPSFPIWAMEFGADYPILDQTRIPGKLTSRKLCAFRGSFGHELRQFAPTERMAALPPYARASFFPQWKRAFIKQNRELYMRDQSWLDGWKTDLESFASSLQKLEWNCKGEVYDIWEHVLQMRASGIRVKRSTSAPALIAMTSTQVPIIGRLRRYMTEQECAGLQSLGRLKNLPNSSSGAFRALGNAVNAKLVQVVAKALLSPSREISQQRYSSDRRCFHTTRVI
jgi:DNA (cytosine-5)-methyltransferase 1